MAPLLVSPFPHDSVGPTGMMPTALVRASVPATTLSSKRHSADCDQMQRRSLDGSSRRRRRRSQGRWQPWWEKGLGPTPPIHTGAAAGGADDQWQWHPGPRPQSWQCFLSPQHWLWQPRRQATMVMDSTATAMPAPAAADSMALAPAVTITFHAGSATHSGNKTASSLRWKQCRKWSCR